jgi:hypothetical protein
MQQISAGIIRYSSAELAVSLRRAAGFSDFWSLFHQQNDAGIRDAIVFNEWEAVLWLFSSEAGGWRLSDGAREATSQGFLPAYSTNVTDTKLRMHDRHGLFIALGPTDEW